MFYVIEDDLHCDIYIRFDRCDAAVTEIRRRVALPWDDDENQVPCLDWETCERQYWIYECDDSKGSEYEGRRLHMVTISAEGVAWSEGFADGSGWQDVSYPTW